jgi:flavin reductase (DIM6/NTAB) family NADH-FMN oxidoreductase RutF
MTERIDLEARDALRMLAPGALTLLTTIYRQQPNVMTAGWLLPLSFSPVRIGVAVHPGRLTHQFLTKTEIFTLNIPTLDLLAATHRCGMVSGRDEDKFATTGLTLIEGRVHDVPVIEQAVATIACGVRDRLSLGDHDLFVADVLEVTAMAEAFDGRWQVEADAGRVLHHLGGDRYAGLGKAYQASLAGDDE